MKKIYTFLVASMLAFTAYAQQVEHEVEGRVLQLVVPPLGIECCGAQQLKHKEETA